MSRDHASLPFNSPEQALEMPQDQGPDELRQPSFNSPDQAADMPQDQAPDELRPLSSSVEASQADSTTDKQVQDENTSPAWRATVKKGEAAIVSNLHGSIIQHLLTFALGPV